MMNNIYQNNRKTVDYLKFENKIYENYNHFPIGLIIIEKDEKEFKLSIINNYAYDIFDLYHDSDFEDLKKQMQKFKKWENNTLQELNLYNYIFINNSSKEFCGTFISSLSMIYVKINNYNNCIFLSIDNYNDERKDLQINLVKSLKYQYLVTLYHELNNPLNALMNISDDINFEPNIEGKKDIENLKLKLKQINLLVILIKIFIKNFIWYFRVIFELTNNIETNSISKINLEYLFTKNINKYKNLFKYKEIGYEKNYNFLRDKFILSDSKHMNNFFSGIFVYLYHILPKKNGFTITHSILKEERLKINFIKIVKNPNHKGRRSIILEDIDLNNKKSFEFSQSVQTIEITKELLLRLSNMLNLKLKFYTETESDDLILSIILKFSYEKLDILEDEDISEFTPQQKLITLNGINRTIPIYNNWQSFINDGHIEVDNNSSSQIQTSLTTINLNNTTNTNNINYNYNINISVPNDNIYNNNYSQYGFFINNNNKTKNSEQNDILNLENDPFIRMTKEKNPFTKETNTNKLNDSFVSGSNTVLSGIYNNNDEEDTIFKHHSSHQINIYSYNPLYYQKKFDINYNNNELKLNKKAISYEKSNKTVNINNKTIKEKNIPKMIKFQSNKTENLQRNNFKIKKLKNKKKIKCNRCNDVLLCDDEEFNLSTIKNMLKKFNVNCDLSSNGQECIDSILKKKKLNCNCDKKNYKLILLDMMMPIMNGFDTSKKIQEMIDNKEINDLKIVIVSAHIEDNLIESLKQFKCIVEEISKPLKKKKLEEILNNYYFKK